MTKCRQICEWRRKASARSCRGPRSCEYLGSGSPRYHPWSEYGVSCLRFLRVVRSSSGVRTASAPAQAPALAQSLCNNGKHVIGFRERRGPTYAASPRAPTRRFRWIVPAASESRTQRTVRSRHCFRRRLWADPGCRSTEIEIWVSHLARSL